MEEEKKDVAGQAPPEMEPTEPNENEVELSPSAFEAGRSEVKEKYLGNRESEQEELPADGDKSPAGKSVIAGLTEDQIRAAVEKANELDKLREAFGKDTQKITGKLGNLEQRLNAMAGTRKAKITVEQLKRTNEFYPEFAKELAEDLAELDFSNTAESGINVEELEAKHQEALRKAKEEIASDFEVKLISLKHPDWQEKRKSPEWGKFLATKTDEEKEHIRYAHDIEVVKVLDDFDAWKDKSSTKTNRLDRAITPRGAPNEANTNRTPNVSSAFEAGRKEAQRRLGLIR